MARLVWMPSGPDEVCEKQYDHDGAPSLELLKEARQYVTEYKNLKAGLQSWFNEAQYSSVRERVHRARPQNRGDKRGRQSKNQQCQCFDS
jgi:hypothetical protein